jgi:hypothetical protein
VQSPQEAPATQKSPPKIALLLLTFQEQRSWLKERAPRNMYAYVMNKATKQMSVMEEKEINCIDHLSVYMFTNKEHH